MANEHDRKILRSTVLGILAAFVVGAIFGGLLTYLYCYLK